MPLYIKDDATAELVARLARLRGISKQDAVKLAVRAELDKAEEKVPLRRTLRRPAREVSAAAPNGQEGRQSFLRRAFRRPLMIFADASALISDHRGRGRCGRLANLLDADR